MTAALDLDMEVKLCGILSDRPFSDSFEAKSLPVIGPSVFCLARYLMRCIADGVAVVRLADIAKAIGMRQPGPFARAIERAIKFDVVEFDFDSPDTLTVFPS